MQDKSRRRASHDALRKTMELGWAAPQVIANRTTRMALAQHPLSARDRKEFTGMVMEKQVAFAQAWMGAWQRVFAAQVAMATSAWRHCGAIASAAIAPVHAKATSNARRLARTRLR